MTPDQLQSLLENATPGPWAYAHTGEKDNGWVVFVGSWPDGSPGHVGGRGGGSRD